MDIQPNLGATRRLIPDLQRLLPGADIALGLPVSGRDALRVRPAGLEEATVRIGPDGARVERLALRGLGEDESMFLGARRAPTDVSGILSDIVTASAAEHLFPATADLLRELDAACPDSVPSFQAPADGSPFDVISLSHDGEPLGVEVVVADFGAWVRIDGEDGTGHEHEAVDALVEEAAEAVRARAPGASPRW